MLREDTSTGKKDYLKDWPSHYYEIETAAERLAALDAIRETDLYTPTDACRRVLFEKRFTVDKNGKTTDAFMHAWMMIKASAAAGVSFLMKRRSAKELEDYMNRLLLTADAQSDIAERDLLIAEWQDFARSFIASCVGSKSYCSTLFGFIPIKDATVAEKLAAEILLVTRDYPAQFGQADAFAPLYEIMRETFCSMLENGEAYWNAAQS